MRAFREALVICSQRSSPPRISGMPGRRNRRTSGLTAGDFLVEARELERLAMIAEEESYASREDVSPAKNRTREKENGRSLSSNARPKGAGPGVETSGGAACRLLACPCTLADPASLSGVAASVVPVA